MKLFKKRQQPVVQQQSKKRKRVKKNTWYRNFRAWELRLDRRQQQRDIPKTVDNTERTCINCDQVYVGRVCPQCGQSGTWNRYSWRQAFLNFLDIWGLGNRPMFRTIRELFWRPGYMIRDYLNGHRQCYFPPFKLLAVVVALLIFISWLTGVDSGSFVRPIVEDEDFKTLSFNGPFATLVDAFKWFMELLSKNLLYEWLFIGAFFLICVWFAFRRVSKYNFVETYIFLIYVLSQFLIFNIPEVFLEYVFTFLKEHLVLNIGKSFSLTLHPIYDIVEVIQDRFMIIYVVLTVFLFLIDFHQFYGLKWKSTVKRLARALFVGFIMAIMSIILFMSMDKEARMMVFVFLVLIIIGFSLVAEYLRKNKTQINKAVSWTSKLSALAFLFTALGATVVSNKLGSNRTMEIIGMLLFSAIVYTLSIMPVILYKKYHNTWISLLPVPFLAAFMILLYLY